MKRKCINHNIFTVTAIISLALLFSGCSHFKTAEDHKNNLNQAINNEWTAKVNKEWGTVYDLATEASKNGRNRDDYIKHANLEVVNYTIKDVQLAPDGKTATAVIDFTAFQMGNNIPMTTKEEWVLESDEWRREMPPRTPFPTSGNK